MRMYITSVRAVIFSSQSIHRVNGSTEVITSARVNEDAEWVSVPPFVSPFVVRLTIVHTRNTSSQYA